MANACPACIATFDIVLSVYSLYLAFSVYNVVMGHNGTELYGCINRRDLATSVDSSASTSAFCLSFGSKLSDRVVKAKFHYAIQVADLVSHLSQTGSRFEQSRHVEIARSCLRPGSRPALPRELARELVAEQQLVAAQLVSWSRVGSPAGLGPASELDSVMELGH